MAIALIEIAPLLNALFGAVLWLLVINYAGGIIAIKFERFSQVIEDLPVESASHEDKVKILVLFHRAMEGLGWRLIWASVTRNPFRLHLGKSTRLFASLPADVENKLSRELAKTILMRSPVACFVALGLYAASFALVFLVLALAAAIGSGQEPPRFSIFPNAFVSQAKSGLQKVADSAGRPIIRVVA